MFFRGGPTAFGSAPAPSQPAWLVAANPAVGDWVELTGTNISALQNSSWTAVGIFGNTGPSSITDTWNGASMDTRDSTARMMACGGDQDYAGNQAIALRLKNDVLAWVQECAPSAAADVNLGLARNDDDKPNDRHTYYTQQYIESLNRAILFGGAGLYNGGNGTTDVASFNPANGSWDPSGTYADLTRAPGFDGSVAKDPTTENVYIWGGPYLYKWRAATQTVSGIHTNGFDDPVNGGFLCADTRRNRMLYAAGGASTYKTALIDLSNDSIDSSSAADLSGANAANITGTGLGVVFHLDASSANDCFLVRGAGSGGTVYRINAATLSVDTLTTSGGGSIPAVVTGPYSRFIGTGDLGGGVYGCLLIPTYTGNCWFLRTK